jgi:hypothetical protein
VRCELEVCSNKVASNNYLYKKIRERLQGTEGSMFGCSIPTNEIEDLGEN